MTLADLFPAIPGAKPRAAKPKAKAHRSPELAIASLRGKAGRPVASWSYQDSEGFEVLRVYRLEGPEGKSYRPVHPDADGWRLGDPAGPLPLYRLRDLADAPTVFVVEGEKAAEFVRELDLTATTSAHGAASPHKSDWSPLAGKDVVILPDVGPAGDGYTLAVARILAGLTPVPTVRVLRLPGLKADGDDVEQWLALQTGVASEIGERLLVQARSAPLVDLDAKPPEKVPEAAADDDEPPIHRTDLGNAQRLVKRFGDVLRYCPAWGAWLCWDGKRWREDETGEIHRLAKRTVRLIGTEAAEAPSDAEAKALLSWALSSESQKRIGAMVALAWSEPGIPVEPVQMNRNPWLLNVANGTIDLRTGELGPHRQGDAITKLAPVEFHPEAECKRWLAFLARILGSDEDLIGFVRRALGYALTGLISEHALFFLYGTGRNGKSTFLNVVLGILGDYGTTIDSSLLTIRRGEDHPTGLTDLDGRRFVPTSEVEDGRQMAEALVKKLTGGERIKARRMRENNYEFEPTHKIFLAANHKPEIRGTDEGIWSRIKLIPFNVFIPPAERVKDLDRRLIEEEGPGILAWLVRGCLEWQRVGLAEPAAVVAATEGYRAEMDAVGDFLMERCDCPESEHLRRAARVPASTLQLEYSEWCRANGIDPLAPRKFGSEMTRRGFALEKSNAKCWRVGLSLKPKPDVHANGSGLF